MIIVKCIWQHCIKCLNAVYQVLLEAQEIAVRDHNVEFKSNLWIGG